mmetsp:Transcript_32379/g.76157  ORF Transcript_32379/g.76157 Transcript_32379/m.76157 type:complete len:145 (+) Transcript_32379:126-560(+)
MTSSRRIMLAILVIVAQAMTAVAFAPPAGKTTVVDRSGPFATASRSSSGGVRSSSTHLSERQWNFNEGQSPWGMKANAETWNGRVAQVAFVWIFLQELVTGKGVIQGIDEGDWFFLLNAGIFGVGVVGLTGWLALQGDDDYTKE